MSNSVSAPDNGPGGNSNYFLASNCNPVTDLSVVIAITQDIVAPYGFSFQLNAYTPQLANCNWQQYVIAFETTSGPPKLSGMIDNWPSAALKQAEGIKGDLINHSVPLVTLPGSSPTLPAGYLLTISLTNDTNGNITSVKFIVVDNKGKVTSSQSIVLTSLTVDGAPSKPITLADLAPINAFQLDLVGRDNAQYTFLQSGAGTITYIASSPLTVLSTIPPCTNFIGTAEQSNSVYGALSAGPTKQITQTFGTTTPPPFPANGKIAVSRQFGVDQTNLFAVNSTGQLVVFSVQGGGQWNQSAGLGPVCMARPGAAVAASQRFGANNQTDVFLIDQHGQLNVFSAGETGPWTGPLPIGPPPKHHLQSNLAASQQFGVDQTDVFLVDNNGQLNVFWAQGGGNWNGPVLIGNQNVFPNGAPLAVSQQFGANNQTDVFGVDNNGQLNVFFVQGTGSWSDAITIGPTGNAPPGAHVAASQQFGANNQTDVFLIDNNGQLNVFWVEGTGAWNGPVKIGPTGIAPPGAPLAVTRQLGANDQTDVFLVDHYGQVNVFWVHAAGNWRGPEKINPPGIASKGAFVAASHQFGVTNQTDAFILNEIGINSPGWPTVFWIDGSGQFNGPAALVAQV